MSGLSVKACGPAVSIQDRGRLGFQRFGVSPAGAIDPYFLAAANLLAGAPPDAAAIEIGQGVARFFAEGKLTLALAGADATMTVAGRAIASLTAAAVKDGDEVVVRVGQAGAYAYLALSGGIATAPDMGSRAMHRRSGIGGAMLAAGIHIPAGDEGSELRLCRFETAPSHEIGPIRVMLGPQDDYFTEDALAALTTEGFRISVQADRMGVRLEGMTLAHHDGYNIVSDGIVDGSIQVPGDGYPIVLLRDRQTTGGYPKIATIISADIGRFAQIPAGQPVRFSVVSVEQAFAAARRMQAAIDALATALVPAQAVLTSERLLSLNLIGGVTSAAEPLPDQAAS